MAAPQKPTGDLGPFHLIGWRTLEQKHFLPNADVDGESLLG
jgi:hypothetical protein